MNLEISSFLRESFPPTTPMLKPMIRTVKTFAYVFYVYKVLPMYTRQQPLPLQKGSSILGLRYKNYSKLK